MLAVEKCLEQKRKLLPEIIARGSYNDTLVYTHSVILVIQAI